MGVKRAELAGSWYPETRVECIRTIEDYLGTIGRTDVRGTGAGGIVPHAGWHFSGRTAIAVYGDIKKVKTPGLLFIFGMHLPPGGPNFLFVDEGFATPLGNLMVNARAARMMQERFRFTEEDSKRYNRDNTIEVQLPMLKYFFPDSTVVAAGVAPGRSAVEIGSAAADVARALDLDACFIGSTDLTHYGPNYGFTPQGVGPESLSWVVEQNDRRMIDALCSADPEAVLRQARSFQNACCPGSAAAAIAAVRAVGATRGTLVRYSTSYDVHPDSSFVGYAGVVY
jgi:AmmeMemoRadiSam system protein B